ncbi:Rrf2 family transcriptional regulator [bacterium]|nr:Rrf2 family transcriptional regulator [Akkermansiaceae bacterium]MDB4535432.1 Rrf2 family transcriptional regulator [bacterium]MDB4706584.1 Rrf2 family transcriptional regulator [Akkermansiaceae bacterium]
MNANTDFLYRALIYVALHPERWVTAREVTEAYKLSHNHISKVCQELIRCGFLNAQRGRGGGVQLARKPEDIHLGELLFLDDDKPKIIDCETGIGGSCCIAPACRLKEIFAQAKRAFLDAMNSPALDEVISQPKLVSLFDPQAPK